MVSGTPGTRCARAVGASWSLEDSFDREGELSEGIRHLNNRQRRTDFFFLLREETSIYEMMLTILNDDFPTSPLIRKKIETVIRPQGKGERRASV